MLQSIYKEDVFDALDSAESNDYISKNSSYDEINDNIYEILEFQFDDEEIDEFSDADWKLVDEAINEWRN